MYTTPLKLPKNDPSAVIMAPTGYGGNDQRIQGMSEARCPRTATTDCERRGMACVGGLGDGVSDGSGTFGKLFDRYTLSPGLNITLCCFMNWTRGSNAVQEMSPTFEWEYHRDYIENRFKLHTRLLTRIFCYMKIFLHANRSLIYLNSLS